MAWSDIGKFFSQMGTGFLEGRNPNWADAQRQKTAEMLRERIFNENNARYQAEQVETNRHNRAMEGASYARAGLMPDGTTPLPGSDTSSTSTTPRVRGASTGSGLSDEQLINAETAGKIEPAPYTNQPIDVTRGGVTTSLPWEQPDLQGQSPIVGDGGVVYRPTTPAAFQATEAQGKLIGAKATAQGTQEGQTAGKLEAYNQLRSMPEGEEMMQNDPDTMNAALMETLVPGFKMPQDKSDAYKAQIMQQMDDAMRRGDKPTVDRLMKIHDIWWPKQGGADEPNAGFSPEALKQMAFGYALMGPLGLTNMGMGNATSKEKLAVMNEAAKPEYPQLPLPTRMANFRRWEAAEKAAAPDGKMGISNNAGNTTIQHVVRLRRAAAALKNGDLPALNSIAASYGEQTGKPAPAEYEMIAKRVADEIARAYVPTGATLEDRIQNRLDFKRGMSPEQINTNTREALGMLMDKIKQNQRSYDQATAGFGGLAFLDPENEETLEKLGIDTGSTGKRHGQNFGKNQYGLTPNPNSEVTPAGTPTVSNTRPADIPPPPSPHNPANLPAGGKYTVHYQNSTFYFKSQDDLNKFKQIHQIQ